MSPMLLWSFARQELVDRYAGSALGFAWAFLHPLVMLFIFVVIFGQIMAARLPGVNDAYGYSVYLIAGMLPWLAFSNTLTRAASVFVDKKGILSKIALSLPSLPIFIVLAESLSFLIGLSFFLFVLLLLGVPFKPTLLVLPWVFLIQQVLALGLGLFAAVLNVFLRDTREFVTILTQLWFWLTPIVWVPTVVPEKLYKILGIINPMAPITTSYHAMFIGETQPDYAQLSWVAVLAFAIFGLSYLFVKTLEKDVRDFL
ncbi:ABC transporter permease [Thiocystis violacea]|uniref:ABC transporter permease n=1 Tax=Thiocystis violacea TaxID=13725 RepID=UPI001908970C|nr:ABC transporter permease [Thiocystis violacea]MBK1723517.1 ABC transporter permease [Thiocystis violacea]